jgi:26S proteasome regulatory subunit N10
MKKSTVDIDFVLFGHLDDDEVQKKLEAFNNAVKGSSDSSHLVVIPPSGQLLSDQLISSPILLGEGAATANGGGGGGGGESNEFGFDFDPSADPELALALRMSMEEENARQARQAQAEESAKGPNLEGIKEEDEAQPLLDKSGEPSRSGSGDKKDNKKDDGDKMDTS